jgi:phosphatidylglycerophosphate synthase
VAAAADALSAFRLVAAAGLPWAFAAGGAVPLALVALAAATDYLDGPLARRAGRATRYGAILDNVADVTFVLSATGSAAAAGVLSWAVPASIALSAGTYAAASARLATPGGPVLARSRLGHAAGVANYLCAGAAAVAVALPAWPPALGATVAALTVALNVGAVLARVR